MTQTSVFLTKSLTNSFYCQDSSNQPSIDAILQGLTDRPNVQATLILSRKDGSIIRASGSLATSQSDSAIQRRTYTQSNQIPAVETSSEGAGKNDVVTTEQKPGENETTTGANPTELLAASIFQFVNAAAGLGTTLLFTSNSELFGRQFTPNGTADLPVQVKTDERDDYTQQDDQEVQLLRLRTRHQEVIIFPDPRYLCCVVQKIGKQGSGLDTR